jgi:hypothetical protein
MRHILQKLTELKWNGRRLHFLHSHYRIGCRQEYVCWRSATVLGYSAHRGEKVKFLD